jgi:DNA-binding response OmpR family regulator
MPKYRILLVDYDKSLLQSLQLVVRGIGYDAELAFSAGDALRAIVERPVHAVIMGSEVAGRNRLDLPGEIRQCWPCLPIIVIVDSVTASVPPPDLVVVHRPFSLEELQGALARLLPP